MNQSHCSSIIKYIEKLQWIYKNQFNMNWTLYKSKIQFEISKVLKNHWIYLLKYKRSSDMEELVLIKTHRTSVCVQDGDARGLNCRENRQEVVRKRKLCGVAASRGSPLQRMWSEEEEEEGRVRARGAFFYYHEEIRIILGPVLWSSSWPCRRWSPGNATKNSADFAHPTTPSKWTSSVKKAKTDSSLTRYKLVCHLRLVFIHLRDIFLMYFSFHVNFIFLKYFTFTIENLSQYNLVFDLFM